METETRYSGLGKWLKIGAIVQAIIALAILLVWCFSRPASPKGAGGGGTVRSAALSANTVPIALSNFFNAQLDKPWNPTSYPGDDLGNLPRGVQVFDGVRFDIRGAIQLQGGTWKERGCQFPEKVEGIPVQRSCRCLYVLHADGGARAPAGATVAVLVWHYKDGTSAELPIRHDIHVKDWWSYGRPPPSDPNTLVAWEGQNQATARMGNSIRLYKTRFENPFPRKLVATLDYVSAMAEPGPLLVAVSVE
jgi:hypothetical protein